MSFKKTGKSPIIEQPQTFDEMKKQAQVQNQKEEQKPKPQPVQK